MLLVPRVILEQPFLRPLPPPPPPHLSPAAAVSVITLWQASPDSRPTKQIRSCGPVAGLGPDLLHHVPDCAPLPVSDTLALNSTSAAAVRTRVAAAACG